MTYTKNYFHIYLWKGISLGLNFLSMFIVVPFLTKDPSTYGIYTVCISISIFLAYADIGFISAGQKYAAESFAKGETREEIEVIGFTSFILLIFVSFLSLVFLFLSIYPEFLLKSSATGGEATIASSLLLILAIFTPVSFLQRLAQMIFSIRLENYIVQRIYIIGSIIKILSVLWFFRTNHYDIIGYFFFMQVTNLFVSIISLFLAHKRYNYNFLTLIFSLRFSKKTFTKTKKLALSSFYLTITWILYYELDPLVIGRVFGVSDVAIYAIGLTILTLFRSIFSILFSPFEARFNHFIGLNDVAGLRSTYLNVTTILAPFVVIPIIAVSILAKPLVLSWVGINYLNSIEIVEILVLSNLFAFITYPAGMLLMAQERIREMYIISSLIPIVYWIGIWITYPIFGLNSFAIFKLAAFFLSAIVYFFVMKKFLIMNSVESLRKIFQPLIIPIIFLISVALLVKDSLPTEKSKVNLIETSIVVGLLIVITLSIQYFSSSKWRNQIANSFQAVFK